VNYKCGDNVIYGFNGACKIIAIETRLIDRQEVEYYVLEPYNHPESKYYIPTQNPKALSKIRKILTAQELEELFDSSNINKDGWIEDEKQRKEHYKALVANPNCAELIKMIHAIHHRKQELQSVGKKLHQCDEKFTEDAEKLVSSELSLVLDIPAKSVGSYIKKRLDK